MKHQHVCLISLKKGVSPAAIHHSFRPCFWSFCHCHSIVCLL